MARRPRPKLVRTVRTVLREHLREEKKDITNDLSGWWNIQPKSAQRLMYKTSRRLTPQHIEIVIEKLKLDEFDANELWLLAAIEAGWQINPNLEIM